MSQGSFDRDFRHASALRARALRKKDADEREKIGDEVIAKIEAQIQERITKLETEADERLTTAADENLKYILEKQDKDIKKFMGIIRDKNIFIYLCFTGLLAASYFAGYYGPIIFGR